MAEIQAAEPKNLPIFGHTHDLLQHVFTPKDVGIHAKRNMIAVSTAGMTVSSKTDLRFPTFGQQAHDAQIIHLVLFIISLEMFIFSLWGLTPEYFPG